MGWRKRMAELVLAGGLVGLTGCSSSPAASSTSGSGATGTSGASSSSSGSGSGTTGASSSSSSSTTGISACNANPDPCCAAPDGGDCAVKQGCDDAGATYIYTGTPACEYLDGGIFVPGGGSGSTGGSGSGGTT